MDRIYEVAVVGGGIAGYAAALSLKGLKADYLWLGETLFGSKLKSSEYVRNYPSFVGDGMQFAGALSSQMERESVVFTPARIDGIFAVDGGYILTAKEEEYRAKSVILATGVRSGGFVAGEKDFVGRGVSYCAVCDGALYRGKRIAVVLGSAEYLEEAEYLAGMASEVVVYSRSDASFGHSNIKLVHTMPKSIEGGARVERIVSSEGEEAVSGVFFLCDASPAEALVGGLKTDGVHAVVQNDGSTNLEGLFAAGDIAGKPYQFVKAAGDGCKAAYAAFSYARKRR